MKLGWTYLQNGNITKCQNVLDGIWTRKRKGKEGSEYQPWKGASPLVVKWV